MRAWRFESAGACPVRNFTDMSELKSIPGSIMSTFALRRSLLSVCTYVQGSLGSSDGISLTSLMGCSGAR
jgi:hypothetical protein